MSKRVVVTGATGNMGTSVVQALNDDDDVGSVVGLARRQASWRLPKMELATADVAETDLVGLFSGADVVIHLAWLFQPTHRSSITWRTNALGSIRVFDAAAEAGVPALVYASSVGAYSPGPKDRTVDESWPTHGWPAAAYPTEKADRRAARVLHRPARGRRHADRPAGSARERWAPRRAPHRSGDASLSGGMRTHMARSMGRPARADVVCEPRGLTHQMPGIRRPG